MKKVNKLYILLFGALIGLINGFFGGGGGMVVVPLLNKLFKMEQKKAQARTTAQWTQATFLSLCLQEASFIV